MTRETSAATFWPLDPWLDPADGFGMPEPGDRHKELLVLCGRDGGFARSESALGAHGMRADIVHDVQALRIAFFARGGHDLLVLAHDVPPPVAERAVWALRAIDPGLAVVAFGVDMRYARLPASVRRLAALHPTSRAGLVALQRFAMGDA